VNCINIMASFCFNIDRGSAGWSCIGRLIVLEMGLTQLT